MNQDVKKLLDDEATRRGLEIEEWNEQSPIYYANATETLTGKDFFIRVGKVGEGFYFAVYVLESKSVLKSPKLEVETKPWILDKDGTYTFLTHLIGPVLLPPVPPYNGQKLDLSLMIDKGAYRETMVKNKKVVIWNV